MCSEFLVTTVMIFLLSLRVQYAFLFWLIYEFVLISSLIVASYVDTYLKLKSRHKLTLLRFWSVLSTADITSLSEANHQTLIYFAYICQYLVIGSFYNIFANVLYDEQKSENLRSTNLVTILLYQPSNLIMLLGMVKSIRRARITLTKHQRLS